jgi:hypothetical protein
MTTVLLVPPVGDPYGLLAEGKCGARPPRVRQFTCAVHGHSPWLPVKWENPHCHGVVLETSDRERCFRIATHGDALVIAWCGERLPDGILRAWFVADDVGTDGLAAMLHDADDGLAGLASTLAALRRNDASLGTIVAL